MTALPLASARAVSDSDAGVKPNRLTAAIANAAAVSAAGARERERRATMAAAALASVAVPMPWNFFVDSGCAEVTSVAAPSVLRFVTLRPTAPPVSAAVATERRLDRPAGCAACSAGTRS